MTLEHREHILVKKLRVRRLTRFRDGTLLLRRAEHRYLDQD